MLCGVAARSHAGARHSNVPSQRLCIFALQSARAGHILTGAPNKRGCTQLPISYGQELQPTTLPRRQRRQAVSQTHVMAGVGFFIAYAVGVRPAACAAASSVVVA